MLTKSLILVLVAVCVASAAPAEEPATKEITVECRTIVNGTECDPFSVDCDQCDWCEARVSWYYRCHQIRSDNPFDKVGGVWVKEHCADGYLIDNTKPLTNQTAGGQCVAWDKLDPATKDDYLGQKDCDLPPRLCIYGQDKECTKNYWFLEDPWVSRVDGTCEGAGDVFHLESENCGPCGAACSGKGDC